MAFIRYILAVGLTLLTAHSEAAELHAIILIDSEAENIETAMLQNHNQWKHQLKEIGEYTDLNVKEYAFLGKELHTSEVFPFIQSLNIQKDDILIFYFCGHGYRTLKKENPWPYMCWAFENIAVDFGQMVHLLSRKKPKFLLAFAECCNNFIEPQSEVRPQARQKGDKDVIRANYQKLFLETTGSILCSSSLPGEFSWAYVKRGSCFTLAFMEAVKREVRQKSGTEWTIIFERASNKVKDMQSPQYLILD